MMPSTRPLRPWLECDSTCVARFRYDPRRGMLAIKFTTGGLRGYSCTWPQYLAFAGSPSKGEHYNRYFKHKRRSRSLLAVGQEGRAA